MDENVFGRTLDLTKHCDRADLAQRIKDDIDVFSQQLNDGFRWHLGASLIGHPCGRYLWYGFRWVWNEQYPSRTLRLFNRGKREEAEFIRLFEGIGFAVSATDEAGKQARVTGVNGHFGGSLDGLLESPARYGDIPVLLGEFKTKGTGSGFHDLDVYGVETKAERHFIQFSIYAWKKNLPFVIYVVVNKNDDSLIVEIVAADFQKAERAEQRAAFVIYSQDAPKRLSESPSFYLCKTCGFKLGCHGNAQGVKTPPEKNCRSCVNATPVEDGNWHCGQWNQVIPAPKDQNGKRDESNILAGCPVWTPLNV